MICVRDKWTLSRTLSQTSWHGLCPQLLWFVTATFTKTSRFHDLSPFVSVTFMICVHNFPRGEVSVKVGVMEFGLYSTYSLNNTNIELSALLSWCNFNVTKHLVLTSVDCLCCCCRLVSAFCFKLTAIRNGMAIINHLPFALNKFTTCKVTAI